jgi:type II secretory pathway pseudopilin PulG
VNPPRKTTTTRTARRGPRDAAGFTLLELLAIVAATGIIGALGVSAYRTYAVRAEIAGAVAATLDVRDGVEAAFKATGIPPTDRSAAGLVAGHNPAWGRYVEDIDIVNGRVEIRFGPTADEAIAGRTLSITPFETADQRVVWLCGNKLPGVGLEPLGFAGGATEPVQLLTRIEPRYLPPDCR